MRKILILFLWSCLLFATGYRTGKRQADRWWGINQQVVPYPSLPITATTTMPVGNQIYGQHFTCTIVATAITASATANIPAKCILVKPEPEIEGK